MSAHSTRISARPRRHEDELYFVSPLSIHLAGEVVTVLRWTSREMGAGMAAVRSSRGVVWELPKEFLLPHKPN